MAYERGQARGNRLAVADAVVSHLAELVRGDFLIEREGPLIHPFGHLLPKGRRDTRRAHSSPTFGDVYDPRKCAVEVHEQ